ncbi:MAG: serine hydrolase [Myxococcales bacterium]|nr:serine hydrolase [Myxococcales bacterium]
MSLRLHRTTIALCLLTSGCIRSQSPAAQAPPSARPAFVEAPWPVAKPDDEGISSDGLSALGPWFESHTVGTRTSTALFRNGKLLWQHHTGGATLDSLWHVEGPALTATLVGHEPHLAARLEQPLRAWIPDAAWPAGLAPESTLAHVLAGTSGFGSPDAPGADWDYDEEAFALVAPLVRAGTTPSISLATVACQSLAPRLGATSWRCADTREGPGYTVRSTLRDLARVGELWRLKGVFQGERLLPEGFVASAGADHSRPDDSFFGYGWFLRDPRRQKSFPADLVYHVTRGPDGSSTLLAVIPGWQMVVAVGADARKFDFTEDADQPPPAIAKFWMGELPKVLASPVP